MASTFSTDGEGRYRLHALAPGQKSLTVIAPGRAPQLRMIDLESETPPQDFRMAMGKLVRLRIVDVAGKPIPEASVSLLEWKGSKSIRSDRNPRHPGAPETGIPKNPDDKGVWEWLAAPADSVKVRVGAKGYAPLKFDVTGGSTDRTITLKPEHRITGRVTDARTGQPIPVFAVIPVDVFGKDFFSAERFNSEIGNEGRLNYLATCTDIPLRLRIEAAGYRTQTGPEFHVGDETGRTQNFRLQPSPSRAGRVVDADGRPVPKAEVFLATPTEPTQLSRDDNHRVLSDAAGRFEFPDPGEPWFVVARSEVGIAYADFPADRADAGVLTLRPWASVRGRFQDGGKPIDGATVFLRPIRLDYPGSPRIEDMLQTKTDAAGRFEFPRVPPGPVRVNVHIGPWKEHGFRSGPSVPRDLKPGERINIDLGCGGAIVSGKVKLAGKKPADLDCTYSLNYLIRREPGIAVPPEIAAAGFDARNRWREAWQKSAEGRAYFNTLRSWFVKLAPDGSFRISGVPIGEYDLSVQVYAKPSGCLIDPLARKVVRLTVTAADVVRGEVKMPEIAAAVEPVPTIGDTPAISFTTINGKTGTLAGRRGSYTVVHFWASWCVPCKKQLPDLKKLHEKFAGRGVAVLSLSLDGDAGVWKQSVKSLDLPWLHGRLGSDIPSGISSVPAYWLLDSTGKIVVKEYDPEVLASVIEEHLKRTP